MTTFEVQAANGKIYEVEAPDLQSAAQAVSSLVIGGGGVSANSSAVDEFKSKAGAAALGSMQGASMGSLDEFSGLRAGLLGQNPRPEGGSTFLDYSNSFADRYRAERDGMRAMNQAAKTAEPSAYRGGEVTGAMVPAAASVPLATGKTFLGTTARGVGIGAIEGAAHGAAGADGRELGPEVTQGAVTGGALGGLAPGASAVGRGVRDIASGGLNALAGRGSQRKANREIGKLMDRSGSDPTSALEKLKLAALEGQSGYRLMDALGVQGQRKAAGLVRSGGASADEITEFLKQRQAGQPERVAGFVDEGFGMNGQSAAENVAQRTRARTEAADGAYDAARGNSAPVELDGVLEVIDARIGPLDGQDWATDGIDNALKRFRDRLVHQSAGATTSLTNFDRVLGIKQEVSDAIGSAQRAGRSNEARELGKLKSALDAALEKASPSYRNANDDFARASREIDAVATGERMARPSMRAQDNANSVAQMTGAQVEAARIGYGDRVLQRLEANGSPTSNKAGVLASPKSRSDIETLTTDPELLKRRLSRENQMWETQNRALGGSRTADNLMDMSRAGMQTEGQQMMRSLLNMNLGDAAIRVGAKVGPVLAGQTDATRRKIVEMLLAPNPEGFLDGIASQHKRLEMTQRLIEALIRNMGRVEADQLTNK